MTLPAERSTLVNGPGNLGPAERWLSVLGGLSLLMSAARGGTAGRLARSGAAIPLLMRGVAGHCGMKAAITGETSVGEGLKQEWRHLLANLSTVPPTRTEAVHIDSMESMYQAELQELHSAEEQSCELASDVAETIANESLTSRLREYATELESRQTKLDELLARLGIERRVHPDDAMRALINETNKMTRVRADNVREAAIVASLQRIIHYKIAGYGTIAAYAKALGKLEEAAHFHELAERDKTVDAQLSDLAKRTLNPQAVVTPTEQVAAEGTERPERPEPPELTEPHVRPH